MKKQIIVEKINLGDEVVNNHTGEISKIIKCYNANEIFILSNNTTLTKEELRRQHYSLV